MGNAKQAEAELLQVIPPPIILFPFFYLCQLHSCVERQLGDLHPDFIALTHELAVFYQETGDPRSALSFFKRTLDLATAIGMHRSIVSIYERTFHESEEACKHHAFSN